MRDKKGSLFGEQMDQILLWILFVVIMLYVIWKILQWTGSA